MRIGLALPQYDFSVPGESPLTWATLSGFARRADEAGFDSLWLSDHLFFDIGKYGGSSEPAGAYEPIATLGALAREVKRARLGTLVLCEALRPATVLAKALASLDRITGGRLDVGLGAGWYEPEYAAIGMDFPPPGRAARPPRRSRADRDRDARSRRRPVHVRREVPPRRRRAEPAAGRAAAPPAGVRRREGRPAHPARGRRGRRVEHLLGLDAGGRTGSGSTCSTPPASGRAATRRRSGARSGSTRSAARTKRISSAGSSGCGPTRRRGCSTPMTLEEWRVGRLVGTVDQVREQAATWASLGVETLILGVGRGPVPRRRRPTTSRCWPRPSV